MRWIGKSSESVMMVQFDDVTIGWFYNLKGMVKQYVVIVVLSLDGGFQIR